MNVDRNKNTISSWLVEPLDSHVAAALNRLSRSKGVAHVAVMPDVHLSKQVCVGTVIATSEQLYPHAVGGDMGCGMAAIRMDCTADLFAHEKPAAQILMALGAVVPTNRHRGSSSVALPEDLAHQALSHPRLERLKKRDARVQFGTLGRGNHFIEFQADECGSLWLMVHSGSRAMGQALMAHHLRTAKDDDAGLSFLEASIESGAAYLQDMDWACRYAHENRRAMIKAVAEQMTRLFGVATLWDTLITCDHNHIRRETHFGKQWWVHRKGALSAAPGEPGMIPGSMGTASFHVEGRGCAAALRSSSHGAGRRKSRTEARRTIGIKHLNRELEGVWFDHRLENRLNEEAPSAYKDIHAVMRAQSELTRIVRKLQPILSYKGT